MVRRVLRWFLSLRFWQKLVLSYLLVAAIPIAVIGISAWTTTRKSLTEQIVVSLQTSTDKIASLIGYKIARYEAILDDLAFSDEFLTYVSGNGRGFVSVLEVDAYFRDLIRQITVSMPEVRDFRVYSTGAWDTPSDVLRPYNEIYNRGRMYLAAETGETEWAVGDGELTIVRGVTDPYTLRSLGAMALDLQYERLFEGVTDPGTEEFGIVVLANDADRTKVFIREQFTPGYGGVPTAELDRAQAGVAIHGGTRYLVTRSVVPESGWTIVCYVPYTLVTVKTDPILAGTLLISLLCFVGIAGFSLLISKGLVRRIDMLTGRMHRVSRGDLAAVPVEGPMDEIGELTADFSSMVSRIAFLIEEVYESRIVQKDAELRALQAQIKPHFLYNSLNIINWRAILSGDETIQAVATSLSDFYRTTLNRGRSMTTLKEELTNIDAYLAIQLAMHDRKFEVIRDIDETLLGAVIPHLVLQPLVENAIEHGIDKLETRSGILHIVAKVHESGILVRIANDGPEIQPDAARKALQERSGGYGLSNVHDRIRIAFGSPYGVTLRGENGWTHAEVLLPGKSPIGREEAE